MHSNGTEVPWNIQSIKSEHDGKVDLNMVGRPLLKNLVLKTITSDANKYFLFGWFLFFSWFEPTSNP